MDLDRIFGTTFEFPKLEFRGEVINENENQSDRKLTFNGPITCSASIKTSAGDAISGMKAEVAVFYRPEGMPRESAVGSIALLDGVAHVNVMLDRELYRDLRESTFDSGKQLVGLSINITGLRDPETDMVTLKTVGGTGIRSFKMAFQPIACHVKPDVSQQAAPLRATHLEALKSAVTSRLNYLLIVTIGILLLTLR